MSLQELVYTSVSQPHAHPDDVKDILTSSERNNLASSITGLLLYDGERYIQILEGDASNVDRLFETIKKDHRHDALELLHQGPITGRSFQEWRMAYESLPMGILADLAENMAVFSMELDGEALAAGESFGAKLNGMFIDAIAAE
jgi:hypothetical protein